LQGRVPVHQGTGPGLSSYQIGEKGGVESVTLTVQQIPIHNHAFFASQSPGNVNNPSNGLPANSTSVKIYLEDSPDSTMAASLMSPVGGNQPHENLQPYLCISFIISLFGIFPSPN